MSIQIPSLRGSPTAPVTDASSSRLPVTCDPDVVSTVLPYHPDPPFFVQTLTFAEVDDVLWHTFHYDFFFIPSTMFTVFATGPLSFVSCNVRHVVSPLYRDNPMKTTVLRVDYWLHIESISANC